MNCETFEARLNELLDDRAPLDLDEGLREHHERCRECRLLFASYSELAHAVSFQSPLQPDVALTDKIVTASLRRDKAERAELFPERSGRTGAGRWVRVSQVVAGVAVVSAVVLAMLMLPWIPGPVANRPKDPAIEESKDADFSEMARDYTHCWAELARETRNELADVSSLAPRLNVLPAAGLLVADPPLGSESAVMAVHVAESLSPLAQSAVDTFGFLFNAPSGENGEL